MPDARRKHSFLLDPRFQLKWTGYLVAVVLVVMTVLGVVIARTAARASDSADLAVSQTERAVKESQTSSIMARQSVALAAGDSPSFASLMDEELAKHDAAFAKELETVRRQQAEIARDRQTMRTLLFVAGAVLVMLLIVMGTVITHRIVGPVHKMKRLLRRVSTGRLVVDERLRKGDELEDLFETFLQMTYSLRAMQHARLATLDDTLARAHATGAAPEVQDGLRALRAQMVLGLEKRRPSTLPPPRT